MRQHHLLAMLCSAHGCPGQSQFLPFSLSHSPAAAGAGWGGTLAAAAASLAGLEATPHWLPPSPCCDYEHNTDFCIT